MSRFGKERWQAVADHLDRAMDLDAGARSKWLEELRVRHPDVADDLHQLLAEHDAAIEERFLEHPASDLVVSHALAGTVVGAYRLVEPIGQGGMGTVWLAERCDGRFEGRVAIKLLNLALMGPSPSHGEERFKREGSLLARLTHPNIARLIDAGVSPTGQPYLVLEHVDGVPIDQYCDAHAVDIDGRLRLFLDVLGAVAHAHANLVVHRDLKPSNVLVSADGRVKLLDFGIAKLLEGDASDGGPGLLTRDAGAAMTPEFAAPEQVTGNQVTTATDVYSLGVLLYLLLGGRHPAGAGLRSPADLVKAIVDTEPPRLSDAVTRSVADEAADVSSGNAARRATTPDKLRRVLQGDLDTIVATALKKNAHERYSSVTALADDVRRYLGQEPIGARPDTIAYRTSKFVRRNARGVVLGACVLLLIVGLIGFYTRRLAAERDRARIEAAKSAKVSELMRDLLTGADPYRDRPDPTVRELLDAGAARVRRDLATEPELRAEMLTEIGRVYQRLEALDKAEPLLEEALDIGRRNTPDHPRVAQTLNDLGVLLRMKGDVPRSVGMLEEALVLRQRTLGRNHADVAVTLSELGRSYEDMGQSSRAETLASEALELRKRIFGSEHRETATTMGDLGLLLWRRGELDRAEHLLRESYEISRRVLGDRHVNVGSAASNLALVRGDKGDYAAAETLLRQAVDIRREALGSSNPALAVTLNNLSYPLRELKKYDEAIAALDEAIALTIPVRGDESPVVANYRVNLARVYLARGDGASAEPLLRHALGIRVRAFGENDWRVAVSRSLLGSALTLLRRHAEAEALLLNAARVLQDVPGAEGREARATKTRLAALYDAWGRRQPPP